MSIQGIQGSVKTYVVGLILCALLTFIPYYVVVEKVLSRSHTLLIIVGFAVVQALLQMILFLHLGDEDKPKWNLISFLFMALVLIIIVFGSLWIMFNVNERVMPPMLVIGL